MKDARSNSTPYGSSYSTPQPSWDDGDVAAGAVSITATSSNRQQGGSRSIDDGDLVELARARAVAEFSSSGGVGGDSSGVGSSKSDASSTAAIDVKPPGESLRLPLCSIHHGLRTWLVDRSCFVRESFGLIHEFATLRDISPCPSSCLME